MALASSALPLPVAPLPVRPSTPQRGLLVTADSAFARAFRRALKQSQQPVWLDAFTSLDDAAVRGPIEYAWVTLDLDVTGIPLEALQRTRRVWPQSLVAVVSHWWSERDRSAREYADHVIHKPVRSSELSALLTLLPAREGPVFLAERRS